MTDEFARGFETGWTAARRRRARPEILIIRETALQSWIADLSTYALFLALIGTGWWLDSAAMQWVGACVGFVAVLDQVRSRDKKCTVAEARARLDDIEQGTDEGE